MPESSPITAARFSITVDGYEIASFSELQGIRTEIKTVEFVESGDKGLVQMNIPSNPVLATITLKRAQTQDPQMWTWHEAARFGEMGAARKSCSLVMFDAAGKPVARYHLENAWPSKIELGALRGAALGLDAGRRRRDQHESDRRSQRHGRARRAQSERGGSARQRDIVGGDGSRISAGGARLCRAAGC